MITPPRNYHRDGAEPNDGSVFVFGSNLAGRHGAGAAKVAAQRYGAVFGHGAGRQGQSYAIPTKDWSLRAMSVSEIAPHIAAFLQHARTHPQQDFFITRIGCGLAGHTDEEIAPLFAGAPGNCSFAYEWRAYVETRSASAPAAENNERGSNEP